MSSYNNSKIHVNAVKSKFDENLGPNYLIDCKDLADDAIGQLTFFYRIIDLVIENQNFDIFQNTGGLMEKFYDSVVDKLNDINKIIDYVLSREREKEEE